MSNTRHVNGRTQGGSKSPQHPKSNGFGSPHHRCIRKSSGTTNSSEEPIFLNLRSRQAVIAMSEFLAANTPDNQALPPSPPPRYVGAASDAGFDIDTTDLTADIHTVLAKSYAVGEKTIRTFKRDNESHGPNFHPNLLIPQSTIDIRSAAESTHFYYLVAACAYGTLQYVKSLHRAFQILKDPLPKMLNIATLYNRPEIAEYCIRAGARVVYRNPYNLHKSIVTGHSYETFKVLIEHGLDINANIEFYGDILQCAVEDDNLDWVRFCLDNHANLTLVQSFSTHLILAIAATSASVEINELLIAGGANIKGSGALTIASHNGRADLVQVLLKNGADVNEMGVASIAEDLDDVEGTALHLIEKGRKDILQILLDHGADVNQKDCTGKTVMSRMKANGDEVLSSMVGANGGLWR